MHSALIRRGGPNTIEVRRYVVASRCNLLSFNHLQQSTRSGPQAVKFTSAKLCGRATIRHFSRRRSGRDLELL
jgi:hypothetical protein